jgi:hypothetical protein
MHKNEEGVYMVHFYDKHGRRLRDYDQLVNNLINSINKGKTLKKEYEDIESFIVRRNLYNSIDHQ